MKTLKFAMLATTLSLALYSYESKANAPWCHIPLVSTEAIRIQVDYTKDQISSGRFGSYFMAQPWIHVSGEQLKDEEHVRAVLTPKRTPWGNATQTVDLKYDSSRRRFTGQIPQYMIVQAIGEQLPQDLIVTLSLSIVIDGNWQKDPVSGSTQFEMNLTQNPGKCDN